MQSAIVLFAHGARNPEWAWPFRALREQVAARNPGVAVELAFLEVMEPSFGEVLERLAAAGAKQVTVVPLFLAPGGHLTQDLPRLVGEARARYSGVKLRVAPAIGEAQAVLSAIADWICQEHKAPS